MTELCCTTAQKYLLLLPKDVKHFFLAASQRRKPIRRKSLGTCSFLRLKGLSRLFFQGPSRLFFSKQLRQRQICWRAPNSALPLRWVELRALIPLSESTESHGRCSSRRNLLDHRQSPTTRARWGLLRLLLREP